MTFAGGREVGPGLVLGAADDLLLVLVRVLVAGQAAVDDALVVVSVVAVACRVLDVAQLRTVNDCTTTTISLSAD